MKKHKCYLIIQYTDHNDHTEQYEEYHSDPSSMMRALVKRTLQYEGLRADGVVKSFRVDSVIR